MRRTSTVDMTWPGGFGTQLRLKGDARDAVTIEAGRAPIVVDSASTSVGIGAGRSIEDISATPDHPNLRQLVGCRGGGYLRGALDQLLPDVREAGTPLSLLLDDISGCSLIAGFGWSRWAKEWLTPPVRPPGFTPPNMEGVCIGFRPGSSALVEQRELRMTAHRTQPVGSLINSDDPHGWHPLAELPDVSMRRARRIDVWREEDLVHIHSGFQDSSGDPSGRIAVHEYVLEATADAATLTLQSVTPDARILPFMECPAAVQTASVVVGTPLSSLRQVVLERLAKTNGCTHLNDALRALAEVPVLLRELDAQLG